MRHFGYLAVLGGCLAAALWLEPVLKLGVLRRWRRLLLTVAPVAVVFVCWDLAAIAAGHWSFDEAQILGVLLPGGLPLEELLFFVVIPVCVVLGFEAVRAVLYRPESGEKFPRSPESGEKLPHRVESGEKLPRTRAVDEPS